MKIITFIFTCITATSAFAGVTKSQGSWGGRCETPSIYCTDAATGQKNGKRLGCYADGKGNKGIYASCTWNTGSAPSDGWVSCTETDRHGSVLDSYSNSCE